MAKQLYTQITGRMDGYSFYHDRLHGYLVRRTGGVVSQDYQTDVRYAAARDASREFAIVSRTGKLIRDALNPFIDQVKDGTMVNRMNKELTALKQADTKHSSGERRADTLLADEDSNHCFRIFQFNKEVKLFHLLEDFPDLRLRSVTGNENRTVIATSMLLSNRAFPQGATHAGLTLVQTVIDFQNGNFDTRSSRMALMMPGDTDQALQLVIEDFPAAPGIAITCLQVIFYREEHGDFLQLRGKVHGMGIVGISNWDQST